MIMTRMTSDIEKLQQLLQDGLAQFVIQGLTMVVVAVHPVHLERAARADHRRCSSPGADASCRCGSGPAPRRLRRVRDGIANVLADLAESLHGVRIVAAYNRQRHNVLHHRNVVGEYRDANNYTARIDAIYGPGTQLLGFLGQAALLAIGGTMVLHHTLTSAGWWRSSCI